MGSDDIGKKTRIVLKLPVILNVLLQDSDVKHLRLL